MATEYRTPGVYVREEDGGRRPFQAASTSTAGFVGRAPRTDAHVDEPVLILNWLHFRREFVDRDDRGGAGASGPAPERTDLALAVFGFFANGGRLCYVVNVGDVGDGPVPGDPGSGRGVDALALVDEVAIVAAPGFTDPVSHDRLLTHCETLKYRVAALDGPSDFDDPTAMTRIAVAGGADEDGGDEDDGGEGATTDAGDDTGDEPPAPPPARHGGGSGGGGDGGVGRPRISERGFGAVYVPWLKVTDPIGPGDELVPAPPSGHMAGIWALTDAERGVHKAPANVPIRGAVGLTRRIPAREQELLNPVGVNVIRSFPGRGIRPWGARTVAEGNSAWRYLPVRRLFSMIEETIVTNMGWAVFEPNGEDLWFRIRADVTAFLTRLWRDGALYGSRPEEAFFVQCDAETNPPEVRDAGQVVVVVGVAPLKPAEFIIFRVSQFEAGTASVTEGAA